MPAMRTSTMRLEQRQEERRQGTEGDLLSSHDAFDADERATFKALERRRHIRRDVDVRRAIAALPH